MSVIVVVYFLRLRRNTHWHEYASYDSLLSRAGLGQLGKGWIVRGPTTRRLPYQANGLFYRVSYTPSKLLSYLV